MLDKTPLPRRHPRFFSLVNVFSIAFLILVLVSVSKAAPHLQSSPQRAELPHGTADNAIDALDLNASFSLSSIIREILGVQAHPIPSKPKAQDPELTGPAPTRAPPRTATTTAPTSSNPLSPRFCSFFYATPIFSIPIYSTDAHSYAPPPTTLLPP